MTLVQAAIWLMARRDWRQRWGTLLVLGLLVTVGGGTAIAAVAGASRTSSAYSRLVDRLDVPNVSVDGSDSVEDLDTALIDQVVSIPGVTGAAAIAFLAAAPVDFPSYFAFAFLAERGEHGRFLRLEGRAIEQMSSLAADEIVLNEAMQQRLDRHPGDSIPIQTLTLDEWLTTFEGQAVVPTLPVVSLRIVEVAQANEDITDAPDPIIILSPAFLAAHPEVGQCACTVQVNVDPDAADQVIPQLQALYPAAIVGYAEDFEARISDTVSLQRRAWLVIALAAALAGALAVLQAARWLMRGLSGDDRARAALGMTPHDRRIGRVVSLLPAAVGGAIGAVVLAYLLSGLAPVGLTRRAETQPGLRWDGVVLLGGGLVVLVLGVGLVVAAAVVPTRARNWRRLGASTTPVVDLGSRLASGPGRGAIVGVLLGAAGLVGALTVDRSIDRLLTTPASYGADFDASVSIDNGVDKEALVARLVADPDIEAVAAVWSVSPGTDGLITAIGPAGEQVIEPHAFADGKGTIAVRLTRGRAPGRPDEAAVGRRIMDAIGADVGDRITLDSPLGIRTFTIVGDNIDPGVDESGTGFAVTIDGLASLAESGPELTVARFARNTDHAAILARHADVNLEPVGPPSEVRNIGQLGGLPGRVGGLLALLGLAALANSIVLTVRQSRRHLAIHRALGFTSAQVVRAHLWQGIVTAVAGVAVGGTVGFIVGRAVYDALIHNVGLDARGVLPAAVWGVIAVSLGVCLAVSAVASGFALRRRPGQVLRAE